MQLKVSELSDHIARREEGTVTAKLSNFTINDDATALTVKNGSEKVFAMDEAATKAVTKYLKIPGSFYDDLTPAFRAQVLRYKFDRHSDADTMVESLNDDIISVHQPSQTILPLARVADVVTRVLKPEDTIRRLMTDETRFHLDATTADHRLDLGTTKSAGVFGVGDITEGGFRVLSYPFQSKAPSVMTYVERLECTNGQVSEEKLGKVTLKGRTVDEVIASMEEAAQLVLSQLDGYLDKLAATRNMIVPGSPAAFCARLAAERKLSTKVLTAVLDIVNQLPEPVSVWDVNQAFTNVANGVERYSTMVNMQTLGGHLAFNGEQMIHRCVTCERIL
jgi:hypothetical protein